MDKPFIDPELLKISDYPTNLIPACAKAFAIMTECGTGVMKGFYDPTTNELHIQELDYNDVFKQQ